MEPIRFEACVVVREGHDVPGEHVEWQLYSEAGRKLAELLRDAKGERFVVCGRRHSERTWVPAIPEYTPGFVVPPRGGTRELLTLEVGRVIERYPVHTNFAPPPLVRDMDWSELRCTAWQEIGRRWAAWCRRWWRAINLQEE